MSLHIQMTEEAEHEIRSQRARGMLAATCMAILSITLLVVLLYIAKGWIEPEPIPIKIYDPGPPQHSKTTPEPPKFPEPPRPVPSPGGAINDTIISTNPADSYINIKDFNIDDISHQGSEPYAGDMLPDAPGGLVDNTIGSTDNNGSSLVGTFYDFKQTSRGKPTGISPAQAAQLMKEFVNGKWNTRLLDPYYKADVNLYSSLFYISRRAATEAPKAYKCEGKVEDSRWCAIYRGNVQAPASGRFRFVGAGDDGVVVRFNNENVLDHGWYQITAGKQTAAGKNGDWYRTMTGKADNRGIKRQLKDAGIYDLPVTFYEYTGMTHWNNNLGGLACGKAFEVVKGEVYPIEILITEIPGGEFGAVLLIEDLDNPVPGKDAKTGAPILPLFRTGWSMLEKKDLKGIGGDMVPFDPIGPVWTVVP